MPYLKITPAKFGKEAILYAKTGNHLSNAETMLVSTLNMKPDEEIPFEEQMSRYWDLASNRNKTQVQQFICRFDDRELDPDDFRSVIVANELAERYFSEYYSDRQVAIFIKKSSHKHMLYIHALVNNVSMTNHIGCTDEQRYYNQAFNNLINMSVDYIKVMNGPACKAESSSYIWLEDLRRRIINAMYNSIDEDDFLATLEMNGVHAIIKDLNIEYELVDILSFDGKIPWKLKISGIDLGDGYTLQDFESIRKSIL